VVESNTTPQNRLAMRGLPPFINTLSDHLISDVGLLTHPLTPRTRHMEHRQKWWVVR